MSGFFKGIVAVLSLAVVASCAGSKTAGISGVVENASGEEINLYQAVNKKLKLIKSAPVDASGAFSLVPDENLESDFYFLGFDKENALVLFTDSSESIHVKIDGEDIETPLELTGSPNSSLYHEYQSSVGSIEEEVQAMMMKMRDRNTNPAERTRLEKEVYGLKAQMKDVSMDFIQSHKDSPICLAALPAIPFEGENIKTYDEVLDDTKEQFGHIKLYKMISIQVQEAKKQLARQKTSQSQAQANVGKEVPDIVMNNPDGETMKLSDLKGKVVLIDFWASWCGPCRRENPNVVRAYDKYNKDGFEVFSVSLDKQHQNWVSAIEKDNLKWDYHVSDLAGWQNSAAKAYGVKGIPHTVLLDREGLVVGAKLRGPALDAELERLFGY